MTATSLRCGAHRRLPAKNTLTTENAGAVEKAYLAVLHASPRGASDHPAEPGSELDESLPARPQNGVRFAAQHGSTHINDQGSLATQLVAPLRKPIRRRNKAHRMFVAAQPCLVCQRSPCDAHHLKFAQPRTLGRKVSDEFTMPLCRDHHQELRRHGNEIAWWANVNLAPLEVARSLWEATLSGRDNRVSQVPPVARDESQSPTPK
jgi:hypothetical protein